MPPTKVHSPNFPCVLRTQPLNGCERSYAGNPLEPTKGDTVSSLWHRIKKVQLVPVRGTPASGKSTLANFLKIHVTNTEPDMHVRSVEYLDNTLTGRPIDLHDWLFKKCLLIIDEAQASHQFTSFWNDLIKLIEPGYGIFIVLFFFFLWIAFARIIGSKDRNAVLLQTGSKGWYQKDHFKPEPLYSLQSFRV